MKEISLGPCPICDREMIEGRSVNKHHFIPKCEGGRISENLHKICHRKIHSLFNENELRDIYNTAESLRDVPAMIRFIAWVKKKEPTYYDTSRNYKHKKK